ncbi:hypothetical protein GC167_07870 [bacterium]|nr:hypothetical protein [bacterium]
MGWWDGFRYEASERRALLGWVGIALLLLGAQSPHLPWNRIPEDYDVAGRFLPLLDSIQAYRAAHFHTLIRDFEVHQVDSARLTELGCDSYAAQRWVRHLNRGYSFRDSAQVYRIARPDPLWWEVAYTRLHIERPQNGFARYNQRTFEAFSQQSRSSAVAILGPFSTDSLDAADFVQLGLSPAQASVAVRFCAGRALDVEALSKLRVVRPELLEQWKPYIRPRGALESTEGAMAAPTAFDWNALGAAELAARLSWDLERAERFAEYRRRLGGCTSLEQLRSDRKINQAEYQRWKAEGNGSFGPIRTLSLNESSLEELGSHPYVGFRSARAIVQFRESVRPFRSVEELRKLHLMEDSVWAKLAPYLEVRY